MKNITALPNIEEGRDRLERRVRRQQQVKRLRARARQIAIGAGSTFDNHDLADIYRQARKNAAQRHIPFELTLDEFLELCEASGMRCQVTGIPFDMGRMPGIRRPWFPSLDRMNSAKGYTKKNCRLVCIAVNVAMNEWGEGVLMRIAIALTERHRTAISSSAEFPNFSQGSANSPTGTPVSY